MDRLIEFLKANGHTLLFIVLEVIALALLFSGSKYRSSVVLSTAGTVAGEVMELSHTAQRYTGLQEANVELMQRNADLEVEALKLRSILDRLTIDSLSWQRLALDSVERTFPYDYVVAKVVGNTQFSQNNYLTLDMGRNAGIKPDMGVVGANSIVGVVEAVGTRYAKVIPLVNSKFSITCKLSDTEYTGTLRWNGKSIEQTLLTNLPKHVQYEVGDSVFTSGYSAIFPEHLFVGTVSGLGESSDDSFYALNVKLATDFATLKYVYVLKNYELAERMRVETYSIEDGDPELN